MANADLLKIKINDLGKKILMSNLRITNLRICHYLLEFTARKLRILQHLKLLNIMACTKCEKDSTLSNFPAHFKENPS